MGSYLRVLGPRWHRDTKTPPSRWAEKIANCGWAALYRAHDVPGSEVKFIPIIPGWLALVYSSRTSEETNG